MRKNSSGFALVYLLIPIVLAVVAVTGFFVWNNRSRSEDSSAETTIPGAQQAQDISNSEENSSNEINQDSLLLDAGSFSKSESDYRGYFEAKGYVTTELKDEAFCEENCQKDTVVFYKITESPNTSIYEFIKDWEGNSFVKDSALSIGCDVNGIITGRVKINEADSEYILASSSSNPIVLKFNRTFIPKGRGADNCYSHFDEIIVKR